MLRFLGGWLLLVPLVVAACSTAAAPSSSDGITWSRVAHDEEAFGGEGAQSMRSVTAEGPGLVAVGTEGLDRDRYAAVWTSPDGITWSRVPDDQGVLTGDGHQLMNSVTAGGPGLVAVGWDKSGGDQDAAVWTSPAGITWSRVPSDEAVFRREVFQKMSEVAVGDPGLVAVGLDGPIGDADAAVWTSSDGLTWSRVPHDEAVFGEHDLGMNSVTPEGRGWWPSDTVWCGWRSGKIDEGF